MTRKKRNRKENKPVTVIFDMYGFRMRRQMMPPKNDNVFLYIPPYEEQHKFQLMMDAHKQNPEENPKPDPNDIPVWLVPFSRVHSNRSGYVFRMDNDIDKILASQKELAAARKVYDGPQGTGEPAKKDQTEDGAVPVASNVSETANGQDGSSD